MTEACSRVHESAFADWAAGKPEVVALSGDLTNSTELGAFRRRFPGRFLSMGMAEQNMVGWAGGLAREGLVPFVHTFAVFIYRRALDQLEMSVAYPNLPVKFCAFLPGLTTPGGVTHQAIDDISALRGVPNLRIIEVGDATEIESAPAAAYSEDGPVYLRMLRGQVPRLFPASEPLRFGRARVLAAGSDIAVLTSGICTAEALRATAALQKRGVSLTHLHISTLKPFDDETVAAALARAKHGVIAMENHVVTGGLGSAAAEMIAERGIHCRLVRMGIKDCYSHGASLPYLLREHGLDAAALVEQAENLLGSKLGIGSEELAAAQPEQAPSLSIDQLEAL